MFFRRWPRLWTCQVPFLQSVATSRRYCTIDSSEELPDTPIAPEKESSSSRGVPTVPKGSMHPLHDLLGITTSDTLSEYITERGSRLCNYNVAGDITSTLRQDLSNAHRSPQRFQELLVARCEKEIQYLSIAGVTLILEWARKLKLLKCRWEAFAQWYETQKPWPTEANARIPLEIAMAAGAHSLDAWNDFARIYRHAFNEHPPFDYFVLAASERCNALKKAHSDVRSHPIGTIEGINAAKNLQAVESDVRSFIHIGLQALRDAEVPVGHEKNEKIAEIIIRSNLYFRSVFLSMRHLWVHLLTKADGKVSEETYVHLLSTCGTYNRQDTLVSTDTMLEQTNVYWAHYTKQAAKPFSCDVLFSVLMAYSSCNHNETAKVAAGMLELNLSSLYKKEILKCALYATAQQQDIDSFCTLEEYCKANEEFLGDMKVTLLRRRAHLLSHHPDEDILKFYNGIQTASRDKYLTDIVFRWLEQRTKVPGYLLQSIQLAEDLWAKLDASTVARTSIQIECMMALYAKASSRKGIELYLSTPREFITQKSIIEVLRILVAYGYNSNSKGDAEEIWGNLPSGMHKLLERDAASREIIMRFHPSDRDSDELMRSWFNQRTFDPIDSARRGGRAKRDDAMTACWDPFAPSEEILSGIRCSPTEYIHGGAWQWS